MEVSHSLLRRKIEGEILSSAILVGLLFMLEINRVKGNYFSFEGSYTSFVFLGILITRVQHVIEHFMDLFLPEHAKDRKIQAQILEVVWGSGIFIGLVVLLFFGYLNSNGRDCRIDFFGGLSQVLEPGFCVRFATGLFPVGEVSSLSSQDVEIFDEITLHCISNYSWNISNCFVALSVLYMFLLSFVGTEIKHEMQAHHSAGLLIALLPFVTPINTGTLLLAMLQAFSATFEQPLFASLLYFRLGSSWTWKRRLFRIALVQFAVIKFSVLLISLVILVDKSNDISEARQLLWIFILGCIIAFQFFSLCALYTTFKAIKEASKPPHLPKPSSEKTSTHLTRA